MKPRLNNKGFNLIEVTLAVVLVSISLPAIAYMFGVGQTVDSDVNRYAKAYFLANSLMNEISQRRFWESASAPGNGTDSGEVNGYSRTAFDDIDDYAIFSKTWGPLKPPRDSAGNVIPDSEIFSQNVTVENVPPPGSNGQTRNLAAVADGSTDFKMVTVTVSWGRSQHSIRKIFARP